MQLPPLIDFNLVFVPFAKIHFDVTANCIDSVVYIFGIRVAYWVALREI